MVYRLTLLHTIYLPFGFCVVLVNFATNFFHIFFLLPYFSFFLKQSFFVSLLLAMTDGAQLGPRATEEHVINERHSFPSLPSAVIQLSTGGG